MPITDYRFENRVFFAVESGFLSGEDGAEWARRLKQAAETSAEPIVALVDASTVTSMSVEAQRAFVNASRTQNLVAVVVATNPRITPLATIIGVLGQRGYTRVVSTMEQAQAHVAEILARFREDISEE